MNLTSRLAQVATLFWLAMPTVSTTQVLAPCAAAPDYRQAVACARAALDLRDAPAALAALTPEVRDSQPEIVGDLAASPPRVDDARRRLDALGDAMDALDARNGAADRGRDAHATALGILAQSRYASLHRPPNLVQQAMARVADRVVSLLTSGALARLPRYVLLAALAMALAILAAIAIGFVRSARRRPADPASQAASADVVAMDHYLEADRQAAAGDYSGAVRSLAAAVATRVSGRPFWESSGLTVRELYRRTGEESALEGLLVRFELARYGRRRLAAADFYEASRLAEPYRAALPAGQAIR